MTSRRLYLANEYGQQVACMFFFSSLSALCSVVTLATIFDLHKWTAFNILTFCFTFCQLLYDVSWLMYDTRTQYRDDDFVDILVYDSFSITWGSECSELLFINVLAFTCFYICWFREMIDVKKRMRLIVVFVASCGIIIFLLTYTSERDIWYREDDDNDTVIVKHYAPNNSTTSASSSTASSTTVVKHIYPHNGAKNAFKRAYIITRFILVFLILAILIVIQAKLFWNRHERQKNGSFAAATKQTSDPIQELVSRLFYYPLVLCICKFPVIWDDVAYTPIFSSLNYAPKTDDNITYRVCDWLYYILPPSSGIGFAIIFFRMQPLAWRQLKMRTSSCLAACFSRVIELEHHIESGLSFSHSTNEPGFEGEDTNLERFSSFAQVEDEQLIEIIRKESTRRSKACGSHDGRLSDSAQTNNPMRFSDANFVFEGQDKQHPKPPTPKPSSPAASSFRI